MAEIDYMEICQCGHKNGDHWHRAFGVEGCVLCLCDKFKPQQSMNAQPDLKESNENNTDIRMVRPLDGSFLGSEETHLIPLSLTDDRNKNLAYAAWADVAQPDPAAPVGWASCYGCSGKLELMCPKCQAPVVSKWIPVGQELPPLDADNCCLDEADYDRYSNPVLVFDEDEGVVTCAIYDGRKAEWRDETDSKMTGVTHWQPLPAPPEKEEQ